MQPHIALRYRDRFRRNDEVKSVQDAAQNTQDLHEPGSSARPPYATVNDRSRHAFHILGFDVLLDVAGTPIMLEVNSKPSLDIEFMGVSGLPERSPVDIQVKQRVLTDMLLLVSGGKRAPLLQPVVSDAHRRPAPASTLVLDRLWRVFDVLTRKALESGVCLDVAEDREHRELSISKFTQFARASGLHSIVGSSAIQLLYMRACQRQIETKKSCQIISTCQTRSPSGHLLSAEIKPRVEHMRFSAFARALAEIAESGFETLCGPNPPNVSMKAARLSALLDLLAEPPRSSLPPKLMSPRPRSIDAVSSEELAPSTRSAIDRSMPPTRQPLRSQIDLAELRKPSVPSRIVAPRPTPRPRTGHQAQRPASALTTTRGVTTREHRRHSTHYVRVHGAAYRPNPEDGRPGSHASSLTMYYPGESMKVAPEITSTAFERALLMSKAFCDRFQFDRRLAPRRPGTANHQRSPTHSGSI